MKDYLRTELKEDSAASCKVIAWVVETFEKYSIFELQSDEENTKIESFDKDGVIKIAVGITTE